MTCMKLNRHTACDAQAACAAFVRAENQNIAIIMDTILVSIFAFISICVRLLIAHGARDLTCRRMYAYSD